jgi:hypothetical protein
MLQEKTKGLWKISSQWKKEPKKCRVLVCVHRIDIDTGITSKHYNYVVWVKLSDRLHISVQPSGLTKEKNTET